MKRVVFVAALIGVAGVSCIIEQRGILFFEFGNVPPDVTSDDVVLISGEVFRTPPRSGLITVLTVTGGATTVIDTASAFGLFSIDVPLVTDAANNLVMTARDNSGAEAANPWTKTVVHETAP